MKYSILVLLILLSSTALAAQPMPKVRSINFDSQAIDLYENNQKILTSLPNFITNYEQFPYSRGTLTVLPSNSLSPELDNQELKLNRQRYYTYLYFGANNTKFLEDENNNLRHGYTKIRLIHGDNDLAPVDVIVGEQILWNNIAYQEIGDYQELSEGRYNIIVRDRNTLQNIAVFSNELLNTRAIYSLVIMNGDVELKRDQQLWIK